jgi:hypothetical protein
MKNKSQKYEGEHGVVVQTLILKHSEFVGSNLDLAVNPIFISMDSLYFLVICGVYRCFEGCR